TWLMLLCFLGVFLLVLTVLTGHCFNIFFYLLTSLFSYSSYYNFCKGKYMSVFCCWAFFAQIMGIIYFGMLATSLEIKSSCNTGILEALVGKSVVFIPKLSNSLWCDLTFKILEEQKMFFPGTSLCFINEPDRCFNATVSIKQ